MAVDSAQQSTATLRPSCRGRSAETKRLGDQATPSSCTWRSSSSIATTHSSPMTGSAKEASSSSSGADGAVRVGILRRVHPRAWGVSASLNSSSRRVRLL